jgi:TatD DNase family protein
MLTDTHCHLELNNFESAATRARDAGVDRIIVASAELSDFEKNLKIINSAENIFATIGIHPECADKIDLPNLETLITNAAQNPRVVGIGEIGLDYHYENLNKESQKQLFETQINIAKKLGLPIAIHTRDAEDDTIEMLKKHGDARGVLHCFSSNAKLAKFGIEIGFYFSASGIITFKKSDELREIFKMVPLDKLVVETDAPYLAPTPYRGRENEPAYVIETAKCLAEIHGLPFDKMCDILTENTNNLYPRMVK